MRSMSVWVSVCFFLSLVGCGKNQEVSHNETTLSDAKEAVQVSSVTAQTVAPSDWYETLVSTPWCAVADSGQVITDMAITFQFSSDHQVNSKTFTAQGMEPQTAEDHGTWQVEGNQMSVQAGDRTATFKLKALPAIDMGIPTFVQRSLQPKAGCMMMYNSTWMAIHCPCRPVLFTRGFDI